MATRGRPLIRITCKGKDKKSCKYGTARKRCLYVNTKKRHYCRTRKNTKRRISKG